MRTRLGHVAVTRPSQHPGRDCLPAWHGLERQNRKVRTYLGILVGMQDASGATTTPRRVGDPVARRARS
jgi:hypothetical protein